MPPVSQKSRAREKAGQFRVLASIRVRLFDAHLQPDGLTDSDLRTLANFGVAGALLPAHAGATRADPEALLAHFRELSQLQAARLLKAGIRPFAALGIPPGCAPEHDAERVLDLLPDSAGEARVVAIGLIGLGEGSDASEALFARQLQLALELERPVVVQVALAGREKLTRRTLAVVKESGIAPERVLFARAHVDDLRTVLGCGHLAGLSIRSGRVSPEQAVEAVRAWGTGQLVLGSDAGDGASDLLALPRAADALLAAGLSREVVERVTAINAMNLLGVDAKVIAPRKP